MQSRDGSAGAAMWLVRGPADFAAAPRGGVHFSANVAAVADLHVHARGRRPCRREMHVQFPAGVAHARLLHVHFPAGIAHAQLSGRAKSGGSRAGGNLHDHLAEVSSFGRRVHARDDSGRSARGDCTRLTGPG
jgi:hypothetical protein